MATAVAVSEKTFQYQDSLPSLPVPPLQQSLDKYLESVKPFVTEEEYKYTEKVVREFGDGIGKELQIKLEERAQTHRNWLEDWWELLAYMSTRAPSAINVNFGGPYPFHEDVWPIKYGTQLERMANLLWAYTQVWLTFRREELPVDKAKAIGDKPVCMDQYRSIFNSCRIPGVESDSLLRNFRTESEGPCSGTVAVFRNGHIFNLDVVDKNGDAITPPELEKQLANIRARCDDRPAGPGVGALTAWDRTSWAQSREHLINIDPENKRFLEAIQNAIVCISMDMDNTPTTSEQLGTLMMCGHDVFNRWFDKFAFLVIHSNGLSGCNCDHAPCDAIVAVVTALQVHNLLRKIKGKWQGTPPQRTLPPAEELKFTVDDKILRDIKESSEQYFKMADNMDMVIQKFNSFGKKIMRQFKIHPDTTMQLILQLAYYRMHGKPAPTYETSTTRQFYHGRTETVRSCTMEALEWCKAMQDPKTPVLKKMELFQEAAAKHNQMMFDCVNAQGFDRHLLGLQYLAATTGSHMPDMYLDSAWTKSGGNGNFVLSTSLVGYTSITGCFAPMVHNGYGVTYAIEDHRLTIGVTAWRDNPETDAHKFYSTIVETLYEMRSFLMDAKL